MEGDDGDGGGVACIEQGNSGSGVAAMAVISQALPCLFVIDPQSV
jgi:hypothetical protein